MQLIRQTPILVTGSAGRIGRAVVSALAAAGWPVRAFDRVPVPDQAGSIAGELTDFEALQRAASGVGAIIHLAATPDDEDFLTKLLPSNVVGAHNVLEAARVKGVKRVVLASTGQVNWWQQHEGPWPVRADNLPTPRHWYAATKVFLEAAGQAFARNYSMTVLAVRLGWCPRTRQQVEEIKAASRGQNTYFSARDAGRFFVRAIEADLEPGFSVVFATSRPVENHIFDPGPAQRLLGWEPKDRFPEGLEEGIST
ncbi:MAG: NAD(P)-dependent oxidoreductase [Verrucomicrobia bacterium]|nr:NAD(P)-dependent oxidoreductase [Verrucomicrobiota bacterium]